MPPKNNKKGRNGFYYFMLEVRQDESDRGNFIKTMEELTDFAGPLWRELSADEKETYNSRAKEEKRKGATDDERKFTSLGVSFATVEANSREIDEQMKVMKATIKNLVQSSSTEALIRKPFYFCHVNHYFKFNIDSYQPAEIALAEFSLENGLADTLHFILHPGKIPLGMKGDAQTWAEKTHGIRLTDKAGEEIEREQDYVKVYSSIVNFLKKDVRLNQGAMVLPVIYTMPDSVNNNTSLTAVKYCMNFLSRNAHENRDLFRVYPLPELFFNLRKKWADSSSGPIPSVAILENEIEKDVFSFANNLGCEFHEIKDLGLHCSLSMVKRWVYTVCDHISHLAGVEMVPGRHAPEEADLSWSTVHSTNKKLNPLAEVGYMDPPPRPAPKFVDLTKMQELRIREKEAVEEELSQAQSLPPPQKAVYRGGPLPPGLQTLNDKDFPPIGGMGGGRGMLLTKIGPGVWPISGRGKPAK